VRRGRGDQQRLDRRLTIGPPAEKLYAVDPSWRHHDRVGDVADERVPGGTHPHRRGRVPRKPDQGHIVERGGHLAASEPYRHPVTYLNLN